MTRAFRMVLVVLFLTAGGLAAQAADDANTTKGASPPDDLFERATRTQAVAQRVEELDQEAWRAISKDGEFDVAVMTMSQAADLARTEFGDHHWLTTLKESLAEGMKSLSGLPQAKRQLFIEAGKTQSVSAFLRSKGDKERALVQLRQAQEKRTQALGADHILSVYGLLGVVQLECALGEYRSGKVHAADAVRVLKTVWGEKNPGYAHALYYQATAEHGLHELEPAEFHFRQVIEISEPVVREGLSGFYQGMYASAQLQLARLLNDQGRYADAEPFARRGSELAAFSPREAYANFLEGQLDVARSVSGQGRNAEAEMLFTCMISALRPNPPPELAAKVMAGYAEHLRRVHRDIDADQLNARVRKLSAQNPSPKSNTGTGAAPLADRPATTGKKQANCSL